MAANPPAVAKRSVSLRVLLLGGGTILAFVIAIYLFHKRTATAASPSNDGGDATPPEIETINVFGTGSNAGVPSPAGDGGGGNPPAPPPSPTLPPGGGTGVVVGRNPAPPGPSPVPRPPGPKPPPRPGPVPRPPAPKPAPPPGPRPKPSSGWKTFAGIKPVYDNWKTFAGIRPAPKPTTITHHTPGRGPNV